MQYYIAKTVSGTFPAIVERVIESLKAEGFGVLTEIDVKATMKKKLDIDFEIIGYLAHVIRRWRTKR